MASAPSNDGLENAERDVAIRVRDLSKAYLIFERPGDRLKQMFYRRFKKLYREFWALHHVSFEVYRGETVAIVGRNGSGKTTLLEIIAGTVRASAGQLDVNGRVAALLGLGAGFNPEFSGRENIALNATLLGLTPAEIRERTPAIIQFADIGEFIDQPVSKYSSGMYARLAFAIAISVEPDILIVDESLSVGDEAFQRKCFARIDALKARGATILFVTHSASTVVELCDRAVLLDHGELLLAGLPRPVVAQYQRLLYSPDEQLPQIRDEIRAMQAAGAGYRSEAAKTAAPSAPVEEDDSWFDPNLKSESTIEFGPSGGVISDVRIETPAGRCVNNLVHGHHYVCRYRLAVDGPWPQLRCAMMIRSMSGINLAGQMSHPDHDGLAVTAGRQAFEVSLPFVASLQPGTYFANVGVADFGEPEIRVLHRLVDMLMFRIRQQPGLRCNGLFDCTTEPPAITPVGAEAAVP